MAGTQLGIKSGPTFFFTCFSWANTKGEVFYIAISGGGGIMYIFKCGSLFFARYVQVYVKELNDRGKVVLLVSQHLSY